MAGCVPTAIVGVVAGAPTASRPGRAAVCVGGMTATRGVDGSTGCAPGDVVSRKSEMIEAISSRPYQMTSASSAVAAMAHCHPRQPPRRLCGDLPYMNCSSSCSALLGWRDLPPRRLCGDLPYMDRSSSCFAPLDWRDLPPRRLCGDLPYMDRSSSCSALLGWRDLPPGLRTWRPSSARPRSHLTHVQAGGWFTYQLVRSTICVRSSTLNCTPLPILPIP